MTRDERELAIVTEAQRRADRSGQPQRVYYRLGFFAIGDGGEEVATVQPAAVALAYERPTVAPAGPYSTDLLI